MKKIYVAFFVLGCLAVFPTNSSALTLGFNPLSQNVSVGDSLDVDLTISGLGDFTSDSVGAFDFDISYDSSILSFSSLNFGNQLDILGFGSINAFDDSTPGTLNLYEISMDLPWDLEDFQPGSFTLATLTFDTLVPGTSNLNIGVNAMGDSFGDALTVDAINSGNVIVAGTSVPVPEPNPYLMLLSGIIGVGFCRIKKIKIFFE